MRRENKLAIVPVVLLRRKRICRRSHCRYCATLGAARLMLGDLRRNALVNTLRGNLVREVSDLLPEEIDLLVYA
jgi:hypothetical protein